MSLTNERPILAIHGSASSGAQWRHLIAALDGERIVLAPDLPGYGKNATSTELSAPDRFDWLGDVIQSLGGEFDLVAHSFGGAIAMRLAEQYREHIGHVVLYEPIVPRDGGPSMRALKSLWSTMASSTVEEAIELFCTFWSGEGVWAMMSDGARNRLAASYETILLDFEQAFGGKVCLPTQAFAGPLTILRGDASPTVARHMTEHLAKLYPQADIHVLRGLGHFAPVTAPVRVNDAIRECLSCTANSRRAA